ncbi:MAG: hypothetical protein HYU66_15830, partial [Armatimonadetes bacterium]|nr:hypothetical protein [Armatimonadota bacterium]
MPRRCACLVFLCSAACAQVVPVANPSFEEGADNPAAWTLSGGQGAWAAEGFDGRHGLAVTGDGQDSNSWRSRGLALQPSQVYCLRFRARALPGASGGTAVSGPSFANHDIGVPGEAWTAYRSIFVTPARLDPDQSWLRFGQWQVRGTLQFDQVQLTGAQEVYARQGDLVLGDGEELAGNRYSFSLNSGDSRNHGRVLDHHQCNWNSNRWVFGSDSEVVYRFSLAGRRQTRATAEVAVSWYQSGQLVVEASRDGQEWTELGRGGKLGTLSLEVPAALLPAETLWLRLTGKAKERVGQNSDPGSLQVGSLTWSATVDGPPAELRGQTRFVEVRQADPRLRVAVQGLGDGLPGGRNEVLAQVVNPGAALTLQAVVAVHAAGQAPPAGPGRDVTIAPGTSELRLPYELTATGEQTLELSLAGGREALFAADVGLQVAELYNASFGAALPGSSPQVGLWWCESGWKVSRTRPVPTRAGEAVQLRTARNEADCAQIVVRPGADLQGFTASAGALSGPNGAALPASAVQILRVRYCPVSRPTDATSTAGDWPDPLPPLRAPLDLSAGRNQPLWVRVIVPRDAAPGDYTGALSLKAAGWQAEVPLRVHVYGFALPDRMTCQTAFGFDPGLVFRYHKLTTEAERRAVLDKYWAAYGAHHIAPYNPAPLDRFRVTWPGTGAWTGGARDEADRHGGRSSLRLVDESATAHASAASGQPLSIGDKGLRLRFWYKTAAPGHDFIVTFNHYDAGGQWMSGRNNDMRVQGNGQWQAFDRTVAAFPPGASQVRLTLWPCPWTDSGDRTGTVWYDDISVTDVASGKELIAGGEFEPLDPAALQPSIDWSAWDREMTRAMEQYHFNTFSVPIEGMGGGTF